MIFAEIQRGEDMPTPIGIFRQVERPRFEVGVHEQIAAVTEKKGEGRLKDLVYSGDMWTVD